jgi:hypothetical protein
MMDNALPWYKDWKSWLAIILLIFTPTFIAGIGVMWAWTNWNKKLKWAITLIFPIILTIGVISVLLLANISPSKPNPFQPAKISPLNSAQDTARISDIQALRSAAHQFYGQYGFYPNSLQELVSNNLIKEVPIDPLTKQPYQYQAIDNKTDCSLEATLSTGEVYKSSCQSGVVFPSPTP